MASNVAGVGSSGTVISQGSSKGIDAMTSTDFLKLLISQLSNQDPLQPMTNSELLQQLSGIRQLESSMQTLNHQDMTSAMLLMGQTITGSDTNGASVTGAVSKIIMDADGVSLLVGTQQVPLKNVTTVSMEAVGNVA